MASLPSLGAGYSHETEPLHRVIELCTSLLAPSIVGSTVIVLTQSVFSSITPQRRCSLTYPCRLELFTSVCADPLEINLFHIFVGHHHTTPPSRLKFYGNTCPVGHSAFTCCNRLLAQNSSHKCGSGSKSRTSYMYLSHIITLTRSIKVSLNTVRSSSVTNFLTFHPHNIIYPF